MNDDKTSVHRIQKSEIKEENRNVGKKLSRENHMYIYRVRKKTPYRLMQGALFKMRQYKSNISVKVGLETREKVYIPHLQGHRLATIIPIL